MSKAQSFLVTTRGMCNFLFVEAEDEASAIESFLHDMNLLYSAEDVQVYRATTDIDSLLGRQ